MEDTLHTVCPGVAQDAAPNSVRSVVEALARDNLFMSAVLPKQVFPPLFNRYDAGMVFGSHVDNAIRASPQRRAHSHRRLLDLFISARRTMTAASSSSKTLMAVIRSTSAGDMIVYPATSLHNVTPITRARASRHSSGRRA